MRPAVATFAGLLAGAVAVVGPAAAEWSALGAVRAGVTRCPSRAMTCGGVARADVDLAGLRLWHPWREQAGLRIEADEVVVTVDTTGLHVDAEALHVGRAMGSAKEPARASAASDPDPAPPVTPRLKRSPLHTWGIPVHVRVQGSPRWSHAGVDVTLGEPELHLDGHGSVTASFALTAEGRGLQVRSAERWTATTIEGDPRQWHAEGAIEIAEGPVSHAAVTATHHGVVVRLRDPEGGHLTLHASRSRSGRRPGSLRLHAERFALSTLGHLGWRTLARFGLHTDHARLDAALAVEGLDGSDEGGVAEIERLHVDGLVVDHPTLSRAPVELADLELHGALGWRGETATATLGLSHRQARLSLSAQLEPDAFDLRTELAPLSCQALLDAFPPAMSEMVAGTRLDGQLRAHVELHLDRAALARARAEGAAVLDPEHAGLGRLDVSFPFLERCTVVEDDPRLDLGALPGAHRHRFIDDRGHEQRRVMAPGAPGYVSLPEVPRLSQAFVVLEDRRFWQHDGFDREQMEHAFWHNLVQGRVSRGASTISQQAARNLWLGVDRSWGRKLQEALLTARLEASTDKARIMELYLNVIEFGSGTHGVDEAARLYFGKPASQLSVLQSVHLAALAPAPARYAERFVDGRVDATWRERLHEHLRRMNRAGLLGREALAQALREDLGLLDRR